jgi:hypothetical protein
VVNLSASALFRPPHRLRPISQRHVLFLRPLWMLLFGFALFADVAGAIYVWRDAYEVRPVFAGWGLDYDVQYAGDVAVGTIADRSGKQQVETSNHIVGLNGEPVRPDARLSEIEGRLNGTAGSTLAVDLRQPDGKLVHLHQVRSEPHFDAQRLRQRDFRIVTRLTLALIACATLLICSLLLHLRRPSDPVATLFCFAFAGMAATIDPPIQMWMGLQLSRLDDVISGGWYYLLLIGLATFPDGIFIPKPYRWLLLAAVPLAVYLCLPGPDGTVQALVGIAALAAMLVGQVMRYRRCEPGIERQQIKWAAFGFAAGLVLLAGAFILAAFIPENPSQQSPWVNLTVLMLFSVGMAVIPLGLLVALTRFRLWEADTVITRSAAYAVVTLIVGVVWAASSDLVKLVIEQIIGRQSEAGATTVGAVIAAGVFSPTQSLVLGWTRKRFGGPLEQMQSAAGRLKTWGLTEPPAEVATRALAIIDSVIHPSTSAIVLDGALSRELVAARNASSPNDPHLIERVPIADDESPVGELLLGRRSDGNRYNREQMEAVEALIPALAEALRVARSRHSRENELQQRLEEMAVRLAQLEGGTPKPA